MAEGDHQRAVVYLDFRSLQQMRRLVESERDIACARRMNHDGRLVVFRMVFRTNNACDGIWRSPSGAIDESSRACVFDERLEGRPS